MKYLKYFLTNLYEKYGFSSPLETTSSDEDESYKYIFISDKTGYEYVVQFDSLYWESFEEMLSDKSINVDSDAKKIYTLCTSRTGSGSGNYAINKNTNDAVSITTTKYEILKKFCLTYAPDLIMVEHIRSKDEINSNLNTLIDVTKRAKLFRRYVSEIPRYRIFVYGSITFIIKNNLKFTIE